MSSPPNGLEIQQKGRKKGNPPLHHPKKTILGKRKRSSGEKGGVQGKKKLI